MSKPLPPSNYNWTGDTLTFDLPNDATGVKLKYQKTGDANWIVILDSPNNPVTTCPLASSNGPSGTVCGMTETENQSGKEWGDESCSIINNQD